MRKTEFDLEAYWHQQNNAHQACVKQTAETLKDNFSTILDICCAAIENGNKILFCGNGGSAADAQHLATELTVRFINDRPPIAALALTTDTSTLTAAGNDYGFDHIFSRQIAALGQKGDVLFAISTSGNSANILNALDAAKKKHITTIALTGRDGGKMIALCDHTLIVPAQETARIQEMHILLGHMLCGALEQKLGLT